MAVLNPDPIRPPDHELVDELVEAMPSGRTGLGELMRRWALRLVPFVLLVAASLVLWREFHEISLGAIATSIRAWGHGRILTALSLSAFSFLLMGVVEWLGLRWAGARLPWGPALAGSFLANGIAHTVGANLLVSGAVRARLYERHGVTLTQVVAATLFAGVSFAVGISTLGGSGLLLSDPQQIAATAIALPVARGLGMALLIAVAGYVVLCARLRGRPLTLFGRTMMLPRVRVALAQIGIGVLDNATAAAIIWILLPTGTVHYHTFMGAYAVSTVAGLVSTVPAGVGVFEGSMSTLLRAADAAPLAAAFLGYRLAFYILPLIIACLALAGDTILRRSHRR